MATICGECHRSAEMENTIQCDICFIWCHNACVNFEGVNSTNTIWSCPSCNAALAKTKTDHQKRKVPSSFIRKIAEFPAKFNKDENQTILEDVSQRINDRNAKVEELVLLAMIELSRSIAGSDISTLKQLNSTLDRLSKPEFQLLLKASYLNPINPLRNTNPVILATKYNNEEVLNYLFSKNCAILSSLSVAAGNRTILPQDEDCTKHNAFYYAIRSGNVDLVEVLINKWPGKYFENHSQEQDEILSQAYAELKLKNVTLSEEMVFSIESRLMNLRLSTNGVKVAPDINHIRKRTKLILEDIDYLHVEYTNNVVVDERFLFVAKSIAENIHILKRQLKSTYSRLPWEEMEFCMTIFVLSHQKIHTKYFTGRATLSKHKILNHLKIFSNKLTIETKKLETIEESALSSLLVLPNLSREKVSAIIIDECHEFEELYDDYQKVRDVHSLEILNRYIQLALSANPEEKEGQLTITRAIQVIGEHLKNTLESPKLSDSIAELLMQSLPKNTRKLVIYLRNSLSHAYSLSKRIQMEEESNVSFYIGVKNDVSKIGEVISNILHKEKIKVTRMLYKNIEACNTIEEIQEIVETIGYFDLETLLSKNFISLEQEKLKGLVEELKNAIKEKTEHELLLFQQLDTLTSDRGKELKKLTDNFVEGLATFRSLGYTSKVHDRNVNTLRQFKYFANKALEKIDAKNQSNIEKQFTEVMIKIYNSGIMKIQEFTDVTRIMFEMMSIVFLATDNFKSIEYVKDKLTSMGSLNTKSSKKMNSTKYTGNNELLKHKISELKFILDKHLLNNQSVKAIASYKTNKILQSALEMLALDVTSILDNSLENNPCFLDEATPLLTGKSLRNHLAHHNAIVDVLSTNASMALLFNCRTFISQEAVHSKNKSKNAKSDDQANFHKKRYFGLSVLTNQAKMFTALEDGNFELFKKILGQGSDISAKGLNQWTVMHFAAKSPSIDGLKFFFKQGVEANVKDMTGQHPLHVAAAFGRVDNVRYLVKEVKLDINEKDFFGQTPLHYAALNGHTQIVEMLLDLQANAAIHDNGGNLPVHYAINHNHISVVKVLLANSTHVDSNETLGGFTPLHAAAEYGYVELVKMLLNFGSNVNAKTDVNTLPLHLAALNGHLEVVNILITHGTDVNAKVITGCTPLHYAIENGHETIAKILLENGAEVNVQDLSYQNAPLHYASKDGFVNIVNILLNHNASVKVTTTDKLTPLHLSALSGHLEIVKILLKSGADIEAKDLNYATPLYNAVRMGHLKTAELLLLNNASQRSRVINGNTMLHAAAEGGHLEVCDLLVKNKAEIEARNISGYTPLHIAAQNGKTDIVKMLLQHKSQINSTTYDGKTALHLASKSGHLDTVAFLVKNKASVNSGSESGKTALHFAAKNGHEHIANVLIQHNADVDAMSVNGAPLNVAAEAGHRAIVNILLAKGANVNCKGRNGTPLHCAIRKNEKGILLDLIANGASFETEHLNALEAAVSANYWEIVDILLKNNVDIHLKNFESMTFLHLAASKGYRIMVKVLIKNGALVDSLTSDNKTPLHYACMNGHEEVVEELVANKANVNAESNEGTPLHDAAANGHLEIVDMLLSNGARIEVFDHKGRTPLELSVERGHLQVVTKIMKSENKAINAQNKDGLTLLHIGSQGNNVELVQFLLDRGADIDVIDAEGSKAIHIAAREGHEEILKLFLSKGLGIDELGSGGKTPLHYAAYSGQLTVSKYLISQGANVNSKDLMGCTPVHIAACYGFKSIVEVLLQHGAQYNATDNRNNSPKDLSESTELIALFSSIERFFELVNLNNCSEIEKALRQGININVKDAQNESALHRAVCKGFDKMVRILLRNGANPNAVGLEGYSPLHYAAKYSHLEIVKILLSHGAVFEANSYDGKMPTDVTKNKQILGLFKLINELFRKLKAKNRQLVSDLNRIKEIETVRAVMSCRNKENKTLISVAAQNNFEKLEQLKNILHDEIPHQLEEALTLCHQGKFEDALKIYRFVLDKRKELLGDNNPGTWDIEEHIAKAMYKNGNYHESYNILNKILQKQREMFGSNHESALETEGFMALVLHRQGRNSEALNIFRQVYQRQKQMLGSNNLVVMDTQFHMALVLDALGEYEEALAINRSVYETRIKKYGVNNPQTVAALNNIALVLTSQKQYDEALKIYKEVYEKKKRILGPNHADTLRTLHNITMIDLKRNNSQGSLNPAEKILNLQTNALGSTHPDTLYTKQNRADALLAQGKYVGAFKAYKECSEQMKAVFGPHHLAVSTLSVKLEAVKKILEIRDIDNSEILVYLQRELNTAASNGDLKAVERLLENGADVNECDIDGRSPIHYAINSGRTSVLKMLLNNGADVTQSTNKGNTPLHTAVSKNSKEIVEILLNHVSREKLPDFIDAKTISGGTTVLHVAAKGGFNQVLKVLLKHGATYNIENRDCKTPVEVSTDQQTINLLKLIDSLFADVKEGDKDVISRINSLALDEILAVVNTRNILGFTLLRVAIFNGNKIIGGKLLEIIKRHLK